MLAANSVTGDDGRSHVLHVAMPGYSLNPFSSIPTITNLHKSRRAGFGLPRMRWKRRSSSCVVRPDYKGYAQIAAGLLEKTVRCCLRSAEGRIRAWMKSSLEGDVGSARKT
jgi:hypothetical protein